MVKEKYIHDLLITNSAEFFPVDLVQYQLVHRIMEKNAAEKNYKLSVLAVPRELISSYAAFAAALNLEIRALDYMGNSIVQGMLRFMKEPVKVAIKVDEDTSMLTLIQENRVELQRNISYGIGEAAAVTEDFMPLVGNISRILDYYMSRNQETVIEKIWLMGIGAECKGFDELLTRELGITVQILTELPGLGSNREFAEERFGAAEYLAPISGTFSPLRFVLEELQGGKGRLTGNEMFVPGIVCLICLAAAGVLTAATLIPSAVLRAQNQKLTEQAEDLREAAEVYDTYTETKAEFADLETLLQMTETADDALLPFLKEMEDKMPSDVVVVTMTAGVDGIHMNMTASSKDSAAMALMQLRDFETVSGVSAQEITEETSEEGKTVVSFSVDCCFGKAGSGEP